MGDLKLSAALQVQPHQHCGCGELSTSETTLHIFITTATKYLASPALLMILALFCRLAYRMSTELKVTKSVVDKMERSVNVLG